MNDLAPICSGFWSCVYAFQSLITGILATFAAAFTVWIVWKSAYYPVQVERDRVEDQKMRRLRYGRFSLVRDLGTLTRRAHMAQGSIRVYSGPDAKPSEGEIAALLLSIPTTIENLEILELFPPDQQQLCLDLASGVNDYNFYIARSRSFKADSYREFIQSKLTTIAGESATLRKLIHEDEGFKEEMSDSSAS